MKIVLVVALVLSSKKKPRTTARRVVIHQLRAERWYEVARYF
jgi:hypothetical protein